MILYTIHPHPGIYNIGDDLIFYIIHPYIGIQGCRKI